MSPWSILLLGCAQGPAVAPRPEPAVSTEPLSTVPLGRASGQFHTVPVRIHDHVVTTAILDTGIGIELISRALCDRIACVIDGEFTGKRMSGQSVTLPLTTLSSLELGGIVEHDVVAAVVDIEGFFPEPQIEAFVGLPFLESHPFTLEVAERRLVFESEGSLARRERLGTEVPVRLDRQGPALDIFAPVTLPSGARADVLLDTGSRIVTLHDRYAADVGVDFASPDVDLREGTDETGFHYRRRFARIAGPLMFEVAQMRPRPDLEVVFQESIHDGLVGTAFLSSFVITFDLSHERLWVADPR